MLGGPDGPWPTQNFGCVGHSAFGPPNNWAAFSLVLANISNNNGLCRLYDKVPAGISKSQP